MRRASIGLAAALLAAAMLVPACAPSGPAGSPLGATVRSAIDAGKFFDPTSPTCGLQQAIDAAGLDGGVVTIPPGVYPLSRSLVIRSNITLHGSGPATVLRKSAGLVTRLTADAPGGAAEIEVKDASGFRVGDEIAVCDGEQAGWNTHHAIVKAVDGHRIRLDAPTEKGYRLANTAMAFTFHPAIYARAQADFSIESLRIDGNPLAQSRQAPVDFTLDAVHLAMCSRVRVRDVRVDGWPADGIGVQGGSDNQVFGCTVSRCRGYGFHLGTSLLNSLFVANIARENEQDGLFFCAGVRHCTVGNNVFHGNGWSGIGGLGLRADEWNVCSGNTCEGNGREGIVLINGKNNTVTGNVCVNNSKSVPGRNPGIVLFDTEESLVTANRCGDDQETPTQTIGIAETGASDRNLITGNHLGGSRKGLEKVGKNTQATGNLE